MSIDDQIVELIARQQDIAKRKLVALAARGESWQNFCQARQRRRDASRKLSVGRMSLEELRVHFDHDFLIWSGELGHLEDLRDRMKRRADAEAAKRERARADGRQHSVRSHQARKRQFSRRSIECQKGVSAIKADMRELRSEIRRVENQVQRLESIEARAEWQQSALWSIYLAAQGEYDRLWEEHEEVTNKLATLYAERQRHLEMLLRPFSHAL